MRQSSGTYLEEHIPVERFVTFIPNQGHKAKDMFQGLSKFLKKNYIDIKNCSGQSYDNTSAMSGKYSGVQALVLAENDLALCVLCAGHLLNLVPRTKWDSFEEYEVKAAELAECTVYESETQHKHKINMCLAPLDCFQAPEVELNPSEKF
ncbi:hypothetical protein PR048_006473 [Dryococelus australis]|uniref:DUF4371 domain-containing protein n=1 Tax=Dryococelus australis TaxID=614101 RepID=A0ABQ9IBQ8_9NEOP|nr:hypothetical protein PR048_006473 [Dryococelus australis]